jgi:hypothetical protein
MARIRSEEPIVSMTFNGNVIDIGAERSKLMPPGVRYRYMQSVVYSLTDGTEFNFTIRGLTKPKLQERIKSTQDSIARGWMFGEQWQEPDGTTYWSTVLKMALSALCR